MTESLHRYELDLRSSSARSSLPELIRVLAAPRVQSLHGCPRAPQPLRPAVDIVLHFGEAKHEVATERDDRI